MSNSPVHFICGLPRAGSTLLSVLLRQNPRFAASVTSPAYAMCMAMIRLMGASSEFAPFFDDGHRHRLLRTVISSVHEPADGQVVFDTARLWSRHLPLIAALYPDARVICCVRDVPWVLDSVECMVQRNPAQTSALFEHTPSTALATRIASLMEGAKGFVGAPLGGLREAWFGPEAARLLFVRYESLATDPGGTMAALYSALNENPFAHDFQNTAYEEREYDARLGMPGLHSVGKEVRFAPRPTVLPPDIFRHYANSSFWLDPAANPRQVPVI